VAPQMLFRPAARSIEDFYDAWCHAGAGHHSAVAYGHLAADLAILARLLGVDCEVV
jgi:L-arabinose isomerase